MVSEDSLMDTGRGPGAHHGHLRPPASGAGGLDVCTTGGPGAWEAVFRVSYIDLDGGSLTGGRFWRVTPMVNWHLSDNVRLEAAYGYGQLDRFDLIGNTQFFQGRIQLTF